MVTTRPPKTIVKPTALGPVANTDTKLLIYGLFQKGRVLAQDAVARLMREMGLQGAVRGRRFKTTKPDSSGAHPMDLVERDFNATRPKRAL